MDASSVERATVLSAVGAASGAFVNGFNLRASDVFIDASLPIWVIATNVFAASFVSSLPHTAGRRACSR